MEIKFRNANLLELYETGKNRKYKLEKNIITRFVMRIESLSSSNDIYDLWAGKSLNFEKLAGYSNRFSIRINEKYRLEFDIEWTNDKKTEGVIYIEELSKHYGD